MRIGDPVVILVSAFYMLLIWAVFTDILTYRIPNRIALGIAFLYIGFSIFTHGAASRPVAALAIAAGVFAFGTVLFAFRLMGGGDVKLMAAVALWAGPDHIVVFLILTSLAGGALALLALAPVRTVLAATRARLGFGSVDVSPTALPYGVAIGIGGFQVGAALLAAQGGA